MIDDPDRPSWWEYLHLLGWSALLWAITVVLGWRTPATPPTPPLPPHLPPCPERMAGLPCFWPRCRAPRCRPGHGQDGFPDTRYPEE